jgi:hypothetical protein
VAVGCDAGLTFFFGRVVTDPIASKCCLAVVPIVPLLTAAVAEGGKISVRIILRLFKSLFSSFI